MTKQLYLERLEKYLEKLPKDDIKEILEDVSEHFNIGISNSRTEEDISNALGSPREMAFNLLSQYEIHSKIGLNFVDTFMSWLTFLSIGFSNLILLPLFLSIAVLIGSLFVSIGAIMFSGILLVFSPILKQVAPSIISTGNMPLFSLPFIGMILVFIAIKLNKYMVNGSKKLYKYALKFSKSHLFVLNYFKKDIKVEPKHI